MSKIKESIVIVDDEDELRDSLKTLLVSEGYQVYDFANPKQVLSEMKNFTSFLVVTDYKMPELNGIELSDQLRKSGFAHPIIMLTGYADLEVAKQGMLVGVSELLEKPIQFEKFVSIIDKYEKQRINALKKEEDDLTEIKQLFVEEATDLLSNIDEMILRLEENPDDSILVDAIFRKIHSVKGGAGAIPGGKELSELAHVFEGCLSKIKKKEVKPDAKMVNLYLSAADFSKKLLECLKSNTELSPEGRSGVEQAKVLLQNVIDGKWAVSQETGSTESIQSAETKRQTTNKISEEQATEEDGILVQNEKLDSFMAVSGELVVLKNSFQLLARDGRTYEDARRIEKKLAEFVFSLNKITDQLLEHIIEVRKVTLKRTFGKLPRIVRQASQECQKKVKLQMNGMELGVDKNLAKGLSMGLVHMVRNSIDHGIESPLVRTEKNKSAEGTITIQANESQGVVYITVSDDGAGLDRGRIEKKAIEKGLVTAERCIQLSDNEVYEMIFLPGFSTAEKVTSVSGRGVGMDAVRTMVLSHHGKIRIESKLNEGTRFVLEIPTPRAVSVERTVLVKSGEVMFALPLTAISRITSCSNLVINNVGGVRSCQFDQATVPLRTYHEYISNSNEVIDADIRLKTAIVIQHKENRIGLIIDQVHGQLDAVVRPFDVVVKEIAGFKGTTVLGSDEIAYVVSPEEMWSLVSIGEAA